jgi:hypothetical protein
MFYEDMKWDDAIYNRKLWPFHLILFSHLWTYTAPQFLKSLHALCIKASSKLEIDPRQETKLQIDKKLAFQCYKVNLWLNAMEI